MAKAASRDVAILASAFLLTVIGCSSNSSTPTSSPASGGQSPSGAGGSSATTGGSAATTSGGSSATTGGSAATNGGSSATTGGSAPDTTGGRSNVGGAPAATGGGGAAGMSGGASNGGTSAMGGAAQGGSNAAAGGSGGNAGPRPPFTGPTVAGTVTVMRGTMMGRVAPGFAGFSFEKSNLTNGFFKGSNAALISLFKLLGSGYVRFGGHDVDSRHWQPTAQPVAPGQTSTSVGTADVDGLAAFLAATPGWKAIYGLNLQSETTATNDVAEAVYVTSKLGASLHSFEIGNEWGGNLETQWRTFADAIKAAVPGSQQTGPGACCGVGFPVSFASTEASRLLSVTYHHYVATATDANATADLLLRPDTGLVSDTKALVAAVDANNIRDGFRWGEINTFSHHGKAGVSDAFVSALWGVDNMLTSALNGAAGVNYHGGGQNMDGNTCSNGPASCQLPFHYSPIMEENNVISSAAPLFYGMLLVSRAGTGPMFQTNLTVPNNLNVSAYSIGASDGSTSIVIVNKDATSGLTASVNVGAAVSSATADYLQGPSLSSTNGVTFAGSGISAVGAWQPKPSYAPTTAGNVVTVLVPPISAVLVHAK